MCQLLPWEWYTSTIFQCKTNTGTGIGVYLIIYVASHCVELMHCSFMCKEISRFPKTFLSTAEGKRYWWIIVSVSSVSDQYPILVLVPVHPYAAQPPGTCSITAIIWYYHVRQMWWLGVEFDMYAWGCLHWCLGEKRLGRWWRRLKVEEGKEKKRSEGKMEGEKNN